MHQTNQTAISGLDSHYCDCRYDYGMYMKTKLSKQNFVFKNRFSLTPIKGTVHKKMKILSSMEHKRRHIEENSDMLLQQMGLKLSSLKNDAKHSS